MIKYKREPNLLPVLKAILEHFHEEQMKKD